MFVPNCNTAGSAHFTSDTREQKNIAHGSTLVDGTPGNEGAHASIPGTKVLLSLLCDLDLHISGKGQDNSALEPEKYCYIHM